MPAMINYGSEMIRINPAKNQLEYSTNQGRTWTLRYNGSSAGTFSTLMDGGTELLAQTDKGLYYSTNSGRTWTLRRR